MMPPSIDAIGRSLRDRRLQAKLRPTTYESWLAQGSPSGSVVMTSVQGKCSLLINQLVCQFGTVGELIQPAISGHLEIGSGPGLLTGWIAIERFLAAPESVVRKQLVGALGCGVSLSISRRIRVAFAYWNFEIR